MEFKIYDWVRYIREDTEGDKKTGYYPPIGTIGQVMKVEEDETVWVQWPDGITKNDGLWNVFADSVERVETVVETVGGWMLNGPFGDFAECPRCGQHNHPLTEALSWTYCPYCGEKIK